MPTKKTDPKKSPAKRRGSPRGKKGWQNMSCDEQRAEFLRRLPLMSKAMRGMGNQAKRRLFAAACIADDDLHCATKILAVP